MDQVIARRLLEDATFRDKIKTLGKNYVDLGNNNLNAHLQEFDAGYDMFYCYSPLTKKDLELLDRGHPKRFILPIAATELITMATYMAQMLFGTNNPHRVAAREPSDEKGADVLNVLMRWNAEQQPFYFQGFQWLLDSLVCNRGIMYDHWEPLYQAVGEMKEMEDPDELEEVAVTDESGQPVLDGAGMPVMETRPVRYKRFKKTKKKIGGYTKLVNVSPYEFISDPMFPIYRINEGRFAGHRMLIPWLELERRSKLPVDDPDFVDPGAVERLKKKSTEGTGILSIDGISGGSSGALTNTGIMSRTRFDRDNTNPTFNQGKADKHDHGVIQCWVLRAKIRPDDYDIYKDDNDTNIWEILLGADEVLALNEDPYLHDQYPYAVGESRGSVHQQFAPAWSMIIKPMQDHIDYLKDKHQEALARTCGNIFIGDPALFDFDDFTNPEKIGLIIPTKPEASGLPIKDYFQQVQIQDMTKDFYAEMQQFINFSETATAANSQMQGTADEGTTATQSVNAQQMAAGRLTSIARILSTTALQPQTRRFVSNFQQFLEESVVIRLTAGDKEFRPQFQNMQYVQLDRNSIQGDFDIIAEDLTMPGADTKAVAASTRLIEVAQTMPQFFDDTVEGNVDVRSLLWWTAKRSGMPMDNFVVNAEQANENKLKRMQAAAPPIPEGGDPNAMPPGGPSGGPDIVSPLGAPNPSTMPDGSGLPDPTKLPVNLNPVRPSPEQAGGLPTIPGA